MNKNTTLASCIVSGPVRCGWTKTVKYKNCKKRPKTKAEKLKGEDKNTNNGLNNDCIQFDCKGNSSTITFLLNVEFEEWQRRGSDWPPKTPRGMEAPVELGQLLLGHDLDRRVVLDKVKPCCDAHHWFCLSTSTHHDVAHCFPWAGQTYCLALEQSCLSWDHGIR